MGKVINTLLTKSFWVIENGNGGQAPVAHKLGPRRTSPAAIDADGFRLVDGSPISGHASWWKLYTPIQASVYDQDGVVKTNCTGCQKVQDQEFGAYTFDESPDWGVPIGNFKQEPADATSNEAGCPGES